MWEICSPLCLLFCENVTSLGCLYFSETVIVVSSHVSLICVGLFSRLMSFLILYCHLPNVFVICTFLLDLN